MLLVISDKIDLFELAHNCPWQAQVRQTDFTTSLKYQASPCEKGKF